MPPKLAWIHYMGQYPAPLWRDIKEWDLTKDIKALTEEILVWTSEDGWKDWSEIQFPTPSGGWVGAFT